MLQSRTSDILIPPVSAFLAAVDNRLNGDALLLAVESDTMRATQQVICDSFAAWLLSPVFIAMVEEARRLRGLRAYAKALKRNQPKKRKGGRAPELPPLQPMHPQAFAARLWWLLQEAPSPYHVVVAPMQARQLILSFIEKLFGPTAWESGSSQPLQGRFAGWVDEQWRFFDLDILILSHVFREYFNGLGTDSATLFCHSRTLYLLLSNGTD